MFVAPLLLQPSSLELHLSLACLDPCSVSRDQPGSCPLSNWHTTRPRLAHNPDVSTHLCGFPTVWSLETLVANFPVNADRIFGPSADRRLIPIYLPHASIIMETAEQDWSPGPTTTEPRKRNRKPRGRGLRTNSGWYTQFLFALFPVHC